MLASWFSISWIRYGIGGTISMFIQLFSQFKFLDRVTCTSKINLKGFHPIHFYQPTPSRFCCFPKMCYFQFGGRGAGGAAAPPPYPKRSDKVTIVLLYTCKYHLCPPEIREATCISALPPCAKNYIHLQPCRAVLKAESCQPVTRLICINIFLFLIYRTTQLNECGLKWTAEWITQ